MKIRIKFAKTGVMKFIGHLDIMRYFQKAIRRSGIDVAYSSGYSPHQIMSFAQPLGVGLTSEGEYFDIEVTTLTSSEDMKNRLNQAMAEGMQVKSVSLLPDSAPNAMASVSSAAYKITFREGYEPSFDWKSQLIDFLGQDTIIATKKTKKGESELDIKAHLYSFRIEQDACYLNLDASSSGNLKPGFVMSVFFTQNGHELSAFALEIMRLETYGNKDGEEVPLEAYGVSFHE